MADDITPEQPKTAWAPPPPPPPPAWSGTALWPTARTTRAFASLRGLTTGLTWVCTLLVVASIAQVAAFLHRRSVLHDVVTGSTISLSRIDRADRLVAQSGAAWAFTLAAMLVLLIIWLWRASSNLQPLGVAPERLPRGMAIGGWFIPVANLVLPFLMIGDAWRAGAPSAAATPQWRKARLLPAIPAWWVAVWLNVVLRWIASAAHTSDSTDTVETSELLYALAAAASAVAAVLAIISVRAIAKRQAERAAATAAA